MSILDRYGIREVADVTFYKLDKVTGIPTNPVLYLDTLKVSTIEQTAEQSDARGGKGNPKLITWDYGKEINVTLEDALFSAKSMAIMFGDDSISDYESSSSTDAYIMKTEQIGVSVVSTTSKTTVPEIMEEAGWNPKFVHGGKSYAKINPKFYSAEGEVLTVSTAKALGTAKVFCTFDLEVKGSVIEISANTFPGTYYVTGDTFARSEVSGEDEFFQFIIPKAKVTSENTLTMEAEGDPTVFNMNLTVLRPADGVMMKLVKYELAGDSETAATTQSEMIHNHSLTGDNVDTVTP